MSRTSELTYTPAWWVPGPHLQTLWGRLARRLPVDATRAERWATPDGDHIELRRLDPSSAEGAEGPRLVILHGLEGTIRSHYLRGLLAQAALRGWAADALIFRGCNGEMNLARRMYHSGETSDIDFVVRRLIRERPTQPLVVVGISLGGNVLLKWLGERGADLPPQVRAAVAISVPFDLERGSRHIEHGFSRVYTRHFLRSLRTKATAKLTQYPGLFSSDALASARTLYDFDDAVTAPVHGFRSAHDYYQQSSSVRYLHDIRRPTLLISSFDDPFLPHQVLEEVSLVAKSNAFLVPEFWPKGGHVGFVSGRRPLSARFYAEERALEFLAHAID
ncbi:MAG: hydrolase [bacterium]